MRVMALAMLVFILGGEIYRANAEEQDDGVSLTIGATIWSQYIGSNMALFFNKPIYVTEYYLDLPKGFSFDIWHSLGIDGTGLNSDFGDEVDFTLCWDGEIKVDLQLCFQYFTLFNMSQSKDDAMQTVFQISKEFPITESHSITPYNRTEFGFPATNAAGLTQGVLVHHGLIHDWEITPSLGFNQVFSVLWDSGAYGFQEAVVGRYYTEFTWTVSESFSIDLLKVNLVWGFHSTPDRDHFTPMVGTGVWYTFDLSK